jgi:hypothetical protein
MGQAIFASLIHSDFAADEHGNFEAVVRVGTGLWHFWRDNSDDHRWPPWTRDEKRVSDGVADAGAIIQSTFGTGVHGNFEVVVPLFGPAGRTELWQFFRDNSDVANPWQRVRRVTGPNDHVTGPASLIQSTFGDSGNFELVVPLMGPSGHSELWHFFHDNDDLASEWVRAQRVTAAGDVVIGPGSLIQRWHEPGPPPLGARDSRVIGSCRSFGGGPNDDRSRVRRAQSSDHIRRA